MVTFWELGLGWLELGGLSLIDDYDVHGLHGLFAVVPLVVLDGVFDDVAPLYADAEVMDVDEDFGAANMRLDEGVAKSAVDKTKRLDYAAVAGVVHFARLFSKRGEL